MSAGEDRTVLDRAALAWKYAELAVVVVLCGLFAASYGFNYGIDNQVAYLLRSLCIVNPGILHNDWYASQVTHYHPAFEYLGAALIWLNRNGVAIAAAHFLLVALGGFVIYRLVRAFAGERLALPGFLLLLTLLFVTRTSSVASSYGFDHIFQPSSLGSLGLFAGILFFVEGRFLASGVCLAAGGLFHANYLLLSYPSFGLAHLALGRADLRRRLIRQFAPIVAVTLLLAPIILRTGSPRGSEAALDILFNIRAPHHYAPRRYERNFMPLAAWLMIGVGSGFRSFRSASGKRLGAVLFGIVCLVWAGTLGTTLIDEPRIAQLFVWRFAPWSDVLSQLVAACALARLLAEPSRGPHYPPAALALLSGGVGLLGLYYGVRGSGELPKLVLAGVGLALGARALSGALAFGARSQAFCRELLESWRGSGVLVGLVIGAAGLYRVVPDRIAAIPSHSTLLRAQRGSTDELYDWMREHSPKDAVFLTPPDLEGIRFHGQRAIVVDWKSSPIKPQDVLDWHRRLSDVVGRSVRGFSDMRGYASLDRARLHQLARKYHVDFVVVRRHDERRLGGLDAVYRNGAYSVLKVPAG